MRSRTKNVTTAAAGAFLGLVLLVVGCRVDGSKAERRAAQARGAGTFHPVGSTARSSSGSDTCTGATCAIAGPLTAQQASFAWDAGVVARRFVSTVSEAASASYTCNNISSSSPCLQQLTSALEIFGRVTDRTYSDIYASDILLSARAQDDGGTRETGYLFSVWNNETPQFWVGWDGRLRTNGEFDDGYGNSHRFRAMGSGSPVYVQGNLAGGSAGGDLLFGSLQTRSAGFITYTFNFGTQVQGVTYQGATQYTGVATGSLPTCNGGIAGQEQYDTTTNTMKFCNGTSWQSYGAGSRRDWAATCPAGASCEALEANWSGAFEASGSASTAGTAHRITASWLSPGSGAGAGQLVAQIYDLTASAVLCECTLGACNSTNAKSCNCAGTMTSGNTYTVRWSAPDDGGTSCAGLLPAGSTFNVQSVFP